MEQGTSMYGSVSRARNGDDEQLTAIIYETVEKLKKFDTSTARPGMLFGRIQSGKTRAFLGVIAAAFDDDFDGAIILTKGTRSLARQTLRRVFKDFGALRQADRVHFSDIMELQENLTGFILDQKLIFVVKKEDENLKRLKRAFDVIYPQLKKRNWLIVDDEADLASVTFRRSGDKREKEVGKLSAKIDEIRSLLHASAYLQVTATPYALYLQPEEDVIRSGELLFRPKRPAFTVVLKPHAGYVGGDYYFEKSDDEASPARYFYREVPLAEREALKKEDGRRLKLPDVLSSSNARVVRLAIMNFIVGGCIRRLQDKAADLIPAKFAFLFHTEVAKAAHDWQEQVVTAIRDRLVTLPLSDPHALDNLIAESYNDLRRSLELADATIPGIDDTRTAVYEALAKGFLMISVVNSDAAVDSMLDEDGQLQLQNPLNIFIGGQILDRGITINNLIGFYYGRNPKRFQQDTVLQHSRMYGARDARDLPVTRFYAPDRIYKMMKRIHDFDAALRDAVEAAHDEAPDVYFIMQDPKLQLVACSPNKILFSDIRAVRPGRRIVPTEFQIVSPTAGRKRLATLDEKIASLKLNDNEPRLVPLDLARDLLMQAQENFIYDEVDDDDRAANIAILEHLSTATRNDAMKRKVWLIIAGQHDPRNIRRYREGADRFTDAPDTKQQRDVAAGTGEAPVLMLLRQEGSKDRGWTGLPFWWPVISVPGDATTAVFAEKVAGSAS